MATRPIAITGSAGFVGRHLRAALEARGETVIPIDVTEGADVLDMAWLRRLPEFGDFIHLAGKTFVPDSWKKPRDYFEINTVGTLNCLELCRERGGRLLLASTYVYGNPEYLPIDEQHPVRLWNPYAASKIAAEQLCETYATLLDTPTCILRFFNLYGFGQHPDFLMPKIINGLHRGELALGNSEAKRDYVYIDDAVGAILAAIDGPWEGCERFNVGSGQSHSVAEVVDLVRQTMGVGVHATYSEERRPGEVMDVVADIRRIGDRLGWKPHVSLQDGVLAYVEAFKDANS